MIKPMQQVVIAMRKRDSEAVIAALQEAGVIHLKPIDGGPLSTGSLSGQDAQSRREDERLLARTESTIAELGAYRPAPAPLPLQDEWAGVVENAAEPVGDVAKKCRELQSDLDVESSYGDAVRALSTMVGGLDKSKRMSMVPFLLQPLDSTAELEAILRETLPERYALAAQQLGQNQVGAIAVLNSDRDVARAALSKARLGELRLPGRFDGMPVSDVAAVLEELKRTGSNKMADLNNQREQLAKTHAPVLYAVRDGLKDRVAVHDVMAVSARGKYSMALQGYLPVDKLPLLGSALSPFGSAVSYEIHEVDGHHDQDIPVELEHSSYVKPFQTVMGLMSLPKYDTFDPTAVVAIFFPLFFGIIIADIGYGLLFLAAGMWLLGKAKRNEGWSLDFFGAYIPPEVLKNLGFVVNVMAGWSVLWGVLTGELFGTLGEHLGMFYINPDLLNGFWGWTGAKYVAEATAESHHTGLIPILFPRLETDYFSNILLVISLCFGILKVLWGWGIRIQQGIKHHDETHFWEGVALFGGVAALVLMAFATQAGKNFGALSNLADPRVLLMYIGFAAFIFGYIRVIKQFPMLPVELLSQGGAVMSYARIFAVGLVSAILAKLCTDVGWAMFEKIGVLGILFGLILGVILHGLVLALTLIGHILQPLRLHIVEFLNPTGFNNETSPRYNPLRRLSPNAGQQVK